MLEHRRKPLLSRAAFFRRQIIYTGVSLGLIIGSLLIGVLGYYALEGMSLTDAFLNAAMLMGGMGPVGELKHTATKWFAGFYAMYCGLVLIIAVGLLAAPLVHRFLHRFHLDAESRKDEETDRKKKG